MPDRLSDPDEIGPYRVLATLGEGGMGVVYAAEQRRPIVRRVALKVIKVGMDTKEVLARFESERQALALLDHPNVTKVLDAGATAEGRPYFAMELVRGVPLTRYCDDNRLGVRERLAIFLQACAALQHAHERGIVHRDVKPSNLLVAEVDAKPVLKVIDFGLAKALNQRLTERTLFTEEGRIIGTPEYMSPEQAATSAQDVDARSDVFSLGVVLYELLAGALPFDFQAARAKGYFEVQRCIREEEPPTPLRRISALRNAMDEILALRRCRLQELAGSLKRGLDAITMKAIAKRRGDRYASSAELAADVSRFLAGEPVLARRRGAFSIMLAKATGLHRKRLTLVPALVLAAVVGLGVWWVSRDVRSALEVPTVPVAQVPAAPDAAAAAKPVEWTLAYPSGAPRARGTYDGPNQVGLWTFFHENGRVEANGALDRVGHRTGEWVFYHPDGAVRARGNYLEDKPDGVWTFLSTTGIPLQVGQYHAGRRSGLWTSFHSDGRRATEGFYDVSPIGPWRAWSETGALREHLYEPRSGDEGLVEEAWPDGVRRRGGATWSGQPSGRWTTWHPNGRLRFCCAWESNELCGVFEARRADGSLLAQGVLGESAMAVCRVFEGGAEHLIDVERLPSPKPAWSLADDGSVRAEELLSTWIAEMRSPVAANAVLTVKEQRPQAQPVVVADSDVDAYVRALTQPIELSKDLDPVRLGDLDEMTKLVDDRARLDSVTLRDRWRRKLAAADAITCMDGSKFELRGPRNGRKALVVILRAFLGEVCVYCTPQTKALSQQRARLDALGIDLLVVYPGPAENAESFRQLYAATFADGGPPYHVAYDPDLVLIEKLSISFGEESGTILLDDQGVVQHAEVHPHRADRPAAKALLRLIESLDR